MRRLASVAVCLFMLNLGACSRPNSENPVPSNIAKSVSDAEVHGQSVSDGARPAPESIRNLLIATGEVDPNEEFDLQAWNVEVKGEQSMMLVKGRGQFLCSPTGNCPHWLFRQISNAYEKELELGVAQHVTMQADSKTAYPELLAQQHGSATGSSLRLYQFDGRRYKLTKCMNSEYRDPRDLDRILEKPIITEEPC
jgi:hypothetical protein